MFYRFFKGFKKNFLNWVADEPGGDEFSGKINTALQPLASNTLETVDSKLILLNLETHRLPAIVTRRTQNSSRFRVVG